MEYGKKIELGGFRLLKYKKDEMSFIKVSTLMGNWAMEWREDTLVYHCFDSELSEDNMEALKVMVVNAFMVSSFLDAEMQHNVMIAAKEFSDRVLNDAPEVSEEEDNEILEQERVKHEVIEALGEELKDINKEE